MRRTKKQRGITLIALIITIVLLMVLASVAISSIKNDGIIGHAKNATNKFTEEQQKEQDMLEYYELMLEGKAWTQNGTKVTRGDVKLEVGDTVTLKKAGDTTGIGYKVTVNSKEYGGWKVLGVENGKLLLLSDVNVPVDTAGTMVLTLYGSDGKDNNNNYAAGYLNGVAKLNEICSVYKNSDYADSARSVKIEDINRVIGFVPEKDYEDYYGIERTYTSNFVHPDGRIATEENPITLKGTGYWYDTPVMKIDFNYCWLASSYARDWENGAWFGFGLNTVSPYEEGTFTLTTQDLWCSGQDLEGMGPGIIGPLEAFSCGVCPVVAINPNIQVEKAS